MTGEDIRNAMLANINGGSTNYAIAYLVRVLGLLFYSLMKSGVLAEETIRLILK